jgi:hypothetical protein
MLSGFGTVTERDFIETQILWNLKEHDWAQSVCGGVVNVLRSMNSYFPGLERLTGKGLEYAVHMRPGFVWPRY